MHKHATLNCGCGEVRGLVANTSPETANRVICYCDDCQAFLHHLERTDLLDAYGGTDIIQIAPASLAFVQGKERIVGLRLTPKGLYRCRLLQDAAWQYTGSRNPICGHRCAGICERHAAAR